MKKIAAYLKKEVVLCIAIILAVLSMFIIRPDSQYLSYIDFRTLAILFCLMTIVAGFKELGFFDLLAEKLLAAAGSLRATVLVLVFLCFFLSMVITNDVALITFVPFTITVLHKMGEEVRRKWMLQVVVMQTIAANLGSMFTPIGNPQNLYLFGLTDFTTLDFLKFMFPYMGVSFLLLTGWIFLAAGGKKERGMAEQEKTETEKTERKMAERNMTERDMTGNITAHAAFPATEKRMEQTVAYSVLLVLSLFTVGRILPYWMTFACVLLYTLLRNHSLLRKVDYSLLGTFAALFIFIGNLGRIQVFHDFLLKIITGREVITAVIASQVMSNVPAAILLSGFTENVRGLIVGTNLGGLGTLIASMASLISFKYVAEEAGRQKGIYLRLFTVANLLFLAVLLGAAGVLQQF